MPFAWLTAITVFVLLLPLLWLFLRDALEDRRNRKTPQQLEQIALEYSELLLKPDWAAVEGALEGAVIPPALKALYADTATIMLEGFTVTDPLDVNAPEWSIAYFYPANAEAVREIEGMDSLPRNAFPLAHNEFGDYILLLWNVVAPNPVLYVSYEFDIEAVAPSLETFLSWPRIKNAET